MSEVDWNTELRKIERQMSGLPPEPSAAAVAAKRAAEKREKERQEAINARFGVSIRLVLVAGLAAGLFFWPYAHSCGLGLSAYLAAETVLLGGAVWVFVFTWRHRMPRTHGLALVLLLCALTLLAIEVLPRAGLVNPGTNQSSRWTC
jgi:hypothetical protein